jgi:hypothetical protein
MEPFTRELVSTQRAAAGALTVVEEVYRTDSFPDPRYERIYRVQHAAREFELGRYSDEGTAAMAQPPQMVGEWLVVMSGAHLFFWQAGQDTRHFYPFMVEAWFDFAQARQLNGHYDYAATAVEIDGAVWRITYTCTTCLAGQPVEIRFVSTDGGATFQLA